MLLMVDVLVNGLYLVSILVMGMVCVLEDSVVCVFMVFFWFVWEGDLIMILVNW